MAHDELTEELDEGRHAALTLVRHLCVMEAAAATIPITWEGKTYEVTVKRISDEVLEP